MAPGLLLASAWWPLSPATVLALTVVLFIFVGGLAGLFGVAMGLTERHGPMLAAGIQAALGTLLLCFAVWAMASHTRPNGTERLEQFAHRHRSELIAGALVAGLIEVVGGSASFVVALGDPGFMSPPSTKDHKFMRPLSTKDDTSP